MITAKLGTKILPAYCDFIRLHHISRMSSRLNLMLHEFDATNRQYVSIDFYLCDFQTSGFLPLTARI